MIVISLSAFF